jgi:RecJ-like exonuclease
MQKRRCPSCGGSGTMRGGGMMEEECKQCDGKGQKDFVEDDINFLEEKSTEKYREAIDEIKRDTNLSEGDSEKLLDKQIRKLKREKRK